MCIRDSIKALDYAIDIYVITDDINEETLRLKVKYVDKEKLLERAPSARSVPQIFIDDKHIGGYDDLVDFDLEGGLDNNG